jgi:hypothetical protein
VLTRIDVSGFAAVMVVKTNATKNAARPVRADRFENADTEILRVLATRYRIWAEYFVFIGISYGRGIGVERGLSVGAVLGVGAAVAVGDGNAPRIRCVLVGELMFAFTSPELRCVNVFYSKRVNVVETIQRDLQWASFSSAKITAGVLE